MELTTNWRTGLHNNRCALIHDTQQHIQDGNTGLGNYQNTYFHIHSYKRLHGSLKL